MAYTGENYLSDIEEIYGCERCNLHISRNNLVIYRGNPRSDIMFVGEGPGEKEDERGVPMVGPTGTYLVDILSSLDLSLTEYYITNTVLCRVPRNSDPSSEQMDACSKWLNWQIEKVNPKWIIAVGRVAYSRLNPDFILNKSRIRSVEGEIVSPIHLRPAKVSVIQHPSAIRRMNSRDAEESYVEKIRGILEEIRGDTPNLV